MMDKSRRLEHSVVYRGGKTLPFGPDKKETEYVIFDPDKKQYGENERCGAFSFDIASKGGGHTSIELLIGIKDWQTILEALVLTTRALDAPIQQIAAGLAAKQGEHSKE